MQELIINNKNYLLNRESHIEKTELMKEIVENLNKKSIIIISGMI
jgi:hypothetical protein